MSLPQCYAAIASAIQSAGLGWPIAWGGDDFTPAQGQPWLQVWSLTTQLRGSGDADLTTMLAQIDIMCPVSFGDAKILAYADDVLSVMSQNATFTASDQRICIRNRSISGLMRDGIWRKAAITIKYTAAVGRA